MPKKLYIIYLYVIYFKNDIYLFNEKHVCIEHLTDLFIYLFIGFNFPEFRFQFLSLWFTTNDFFWFTEA